MDVTISTWRERAARERVLAYLKNLNPGIPEEDWVIHNDYLRLDQQITTRTSYSFDLYEVQGASEPQEKKLNRNNAFFVSAIGLFLAKKDVTNSVPLSQTRLFSFPDPVTFATISETDELEQFYNAKLTFKTVPIDRVQGMGTQGMRFEPPTRVAATSQNTWNLKEMVQWMPGEIIIDGAQNNSVQLDLNTDASLSVVGGLTDVDYVSIFLWGNKVINGARKVGQYM